MTDSMTPTLSSLHFSFPISSFCFLVSNLEYLLSSFRDAD